MGRLTGLTSLVLAGLLATACAPHSGRLPDPPAPVAGYWFDDFRAARARQSNPGLIAGAAKVRITPRPGGRIAGHAFNKRSKGVLDDLWARVLYLDDGRTGLALVSVDVIGLSKPRVDRIRARVTRAHPEAILVAATHNHFGPDTLGFWGPAAFGLLPVESGMDPAYLDWLERRVARAIGRAVATARPARLLIGGFEMPAGLAVNMREPADVPRGVQVLRAEGALGQTIASLVIYACHAEALQDPNRWLSADFPGVLYREVDAALGGVTLFMSGPAGGMIEPASEPTDSEATRLAFRERMGGALAGGVIRLKLAGMARLPAPRLTIHRLALEMSIQAGGLLKIAMGLDLLDPRPLVGGDRLLTEMMLVQLGRVQLLSVPAEPTPEVGRALAGLLSGEPALIVTLAQDELAYVLSPRQWRDPGFEYERTMSLGPAAYPLLLQAAGELAARAKKSAIRDVETSAQP